METRLLKFFVAVYEEKNLSRAAEKCFVSQPNISNGIKQLEENIGKKLFSRHKRGVEIKEEGHYLYPVAKRVLGELDSISEMFEKNELKSKIVIGMAESLPQKFKANFFKQINTAIKNVEWDIRPINRDCDLNILVREWKFEDHVFLPMFKENYVLCIPDEHKLIDKDLIEPSDLNGEAFIHCPPCEAHQQCLSILNNSGDKWNTVGNSQNKNEVLTMLMAGMGVSFLPEYFVKEWEGFQIKKYNGAHYYREVGISYAPSSLKNPKVEELIKAVENGKIEIQF